MMCDTMIKYPLQQAIRDFVEHGMQGCRPSDAAEPFNLSDSSALEQVSQTHFSPAKPKSDMMQHINSDPGTSSASLANRWGPNACVRHDVDSEGDLASLSSIGSADSSYSVYDKCEADAAPEHQPLEWQGHSHYHQLHELQRGSSGVVHLAVDSKTLKRVAVKVLPHDKVDVSTAREVTAQRQCLMHPHIIQLREAVVTDDLGLAIIMEYAPGGDLREFVEQWKGPTSTPTSGLPETQARWFFQQLALAVEYCHDLGIAHRDIKLENAVLSCRSSRAILKLCDFGYCRYNLPFPRDPVLCHCAVGTPEYMAPELLSSSAAGYDGKTADIWSMGVLLYVMLAGAFPFWRTDDELVVVDGSDSVSRLHCMMKRILEADYEMPPYLSPSCMSLLAGMLTVDPSQRMTMSDVVSHPWFQQRLPRGSYSLNKQLLAMPAARRTAFCRQSDNDIMRVVGTACGLL